jgi:DNA-binding NarL/FixJ family response regulator
MARSWGATQPVGEKAMRVLIVDDHPLYRAGLREIVKRLASKVEIWEAGDITGGLARAREAGDFDLITLDLRVPDAQGLSGLRMLRAAMPLVPAVIISMMDDPEAAEAAMGVGAAGFIAKSAGEDAILEALRSVLEGGLPVVLPPVAVAPGASKLTPRQRDVLGLVRRGMSNKEIATSLGISVATVQVHVSAILHALGLENRTQAAIAELAGASSFRRNQ